MSAAPLRLVFDPQGEELEAALRCEADVFWETYGNTPEQFEVEYGPYAADTGFMVVLEDNGEAAAMTRFIAPGPAGLKTLNDLSRPPWEVDGLRSARAAGVDVGRTWDIATIAVRRGSGRGGLCAAALYNGIVRAAFANDIDYIVMIMDAGARRLLSAVGLQTQALPGTRTGEYLGSANSTPLWTNLHRIFEQQRQQDPEAYRLIFQGVGLDGVTMPADWTWHRSPAASVPAVPSRSRRTAARGARPRR
ncbi:hypothetical protein JK386_09950 [Nocardioides sp. zg-536]|uniref:Uncharacterized protein n=1 Tax=Nocardioides faecalis TaxID=2803858 RepID=A0A939BW52_9ACTN|nr:hypothetical protein [Nocardioides faecalis]MBM9460227.1 hypothetical protein [Nocardioides faecalis]MBS4754651.1 hypothetical protein [Nocardioides faecalis]QVI59983.1 hypothetical protein KG111_06655 [Nocardioides faecalis]